MKKSTITSLLLLFIAGQLFAQQSNRITLDLTTPSHPSSFIFTGAGYWEQTFNDTDYTFFTSQIFSFSHQIEGPGSAIYQWHGFTVCNSGDNANHSGQWNDHQWGCMAGGGIKTDAQGNVMKDNNGEVLTEQGIPYMVAYWYYMIEPEWEQWDFWKIFLDEPTRCLQILLDDEEVYKAVGVYVNIHPWVYYANLHGDGPARKLNQEGDYFKVIFHGLNADKTESGKSVEHIMAKFEHGRLIQSSKWEWVDLSSLGEIGGFYCTLASTVENIVGPVSPMYFCMDKLQVRTNLAVNKNEASKMQIYSHQNIVYIKNVETDNYPSPPTVEILDMTGRLVYQGVINGEAAIALQVSEGIYNVVVRGGGRDVARNVSTKVRIANF